MSTDGILLVDKPAGITSHGVVARIRKAYGTRKVGHAGTLDPAATGLLVVGVGSATRLLTFLGGVDKEYDATIRLGVSTTTDDAEGEATSSDGASPELPLARGVCALTGEIQQRPSSVSAIKVGGTRAYRLVRAGHDVELPTRRVTVHSFEILRMSAAACGAVQVLDVDVRVGVSSGTYVRALARDLGVSLGVGGHLTSLRRTAVGPFLVSEARTLDYVEANRPDLIPAGVVAGQVLPTVVVPDPGPVLSGTRVPSGVADSGPVALLDSGADLLAVADSVEGQWRYRMVVPEKRAGRGKVVS
ncbi:MAG: tRNA pseudouridine(55) synthase TruB [Candidatus Nanopelagicales bacterium]|nr:tRNA pseudouridine(55) synthase TruB [Candidatus Nanopelagicales bacterium]